MQTSVPELIDTRGESQQVLDLYGSDVHKPGTFASNCLLARRLAERGVRFIQVFIRGWDHHNNLPENIRLMAKDIDHACAGLIQDLKQRGLLDDTLVVWGGEFGRTVYSQGTLTKTNYGRGPSSALLHRLDGRRRRQARHGLWPDRRLQLQHRRQSRARA